MQKEMSTQGPDEKLVIHLRDSRLPNQPLHFENRRRGRLLLTDDPERVTCKRCQAMMKRKPS